MKQIFYSEAGQGLVEYSLIILLVALVVIGSIALFGNHVSTLFNSASDGFQ